ncbi:phosphoribosyl-AMP cyclohydrolase [candidate division KSB1 bacterium]|nr:phosphoribosyl-AMP cyclohydrolase [candidate division KSB1 bacterium]RQW05624.1 MAG: phosphoribosyl-AMP cyclohydrolase [candidate division KSB1 bacterium]
MDLKEWLNRITFDEKGLVATVVQDVNDNTVLMLGYMNKQSIKMTLEKKKVTFWSRSRQTYWTKGETSGNFLHLVDLYLDCDGDAILIKAQPSGPTCHTNKRSCFSWQLAKTGMTT